MNLFYQQPSMGSFLGYLMAGGRATTLEGHGNKSSGGGSLPLEMASVSSGEDSSSSHSASFFQLQDAALERDGDCVSSVVCVQLCEDTAHVSLNGLLRNA